MAEDSLSRTAAQGTAERILEVTIGMLDAEGDGGVRIERIIEDAGVSASSIYHHFGSRDGLIDAARARSFSNSSASYVASVAEALADADSNADIAQRVDNLARSLNESWREPWRRQRLAMLGRGATRPGLWDAMCDDQTRVIDNLEALLRFGQESGFLRTDMDPRAIARFVLGYGLGLVIGDMDTTEVDIDQSVAVIGSVLRSFLADPPTS